MKSHSAEITTEIQDKVYLHIDMDAFFASVEQRDHPEWKGKPVIVGGLPDERRSVVSTASYEARVFGVHSAMPTAKAYELCPHGIYTRGNMKHYAEISDVIMKILEQFTPDVNRISIDEASLDITGTQMLFGPPDALALKIQKEIFEKTKLTVSCGLASTKYLAKLASEVKKPNGFFQIQKGKEEDFMLSLPLKKVWGIGNKTLEKMNRSGFFTTRDIHEKPIEVLKMVFGEAMGTFLYNAVRGKETENDEKIQSHSLSNETTFPFDITDIYAAETAILELSSCVMFRLLKEKKHSRTVFVKIRYEDFSTLTAQETSADYITSSDMLFERAKNLFEKKYIPGKGIRLLGVALQNVEEKPETLQGTLFDFGEKKKIAVENAILEFSEKHPETKIQKARLFAKNHLSGEK